MPVAVRAEGVRYPTKTLRSDALVLLKALGRGRAELSVMLCDDAFIQGLNLQWRAKDAPTDVLSFPMDDDEVLGDVVISLDTATRQAAALGHDLHTELRVLLVHGLLHLLGHDHEQPGQDATMAAEEQRLLAALGVAPSGLIARTLGGTLSPCPSAPATPSRS